MRQQQVISKKNFNSSFINYVSSCQTHKSRTWEKGAAIGFPGIHILMLGTVHIGPDVDVLHTWRLLWQHS
jgi:hypothetical protein